MDHDPIVEEIHRIREEYAARFNYDIAAMVADAQRRQGEDGRQVVRLQPSRPPVVVDLGNASGRIDEIKQRQ